MALARVVLVAWRKAKESWKVVAVPPAPREMVGALSSAEAEKLVDVVVASLPAR